MGFNYRKVSLNPFSPWRMEPDRLQRVIVARNYIIKDLLEKTNKFLEGKPAKHCIIMGARGLGKTHILSLLYHSHYPT